MKRSTRSAIFVTMLVLAAGLRADFGWAQTSESQASPEAASAASAQYPWPNQFNDNGQAFTLYPPQLDRWQGDRLEARTAVSVQSPGAEKPIFGTVWLSARTEMDSATGMTTVRNITATRASFPTATAQAGAYLNAIRTHLSAMTWTVARQRLESDLAIQHASRESESQPLRNNAPRILYSESPAILVPIDGPPQLKEMAGLDLLRVINTRALILQDKATRRYYLFVADHWMEASAIDGPWTQAQVRPSALDEAKQQALTSGQVDLVEGGESAAGRVPAVYVTTAPAELLQTDGPAQYSPIDGTNLLYVTNTPNRLFLDLTTQKYYVLLAGRWFRAASLSQSSWEYVPGTSLPADFTMIPSDHPTEGVRASVPGTPQAQEAVMENSVPQVAAVKRSATTLQITYDGQPQLRPIEGTPLQYVVNAPMPVIQVDPGSFYALDNGVWFVSNSLFGPWTVAAWIPPVVYSIPPSSPLHYVTYVRVYDATPEVVYEGYYPGYVGSYVSDGAVVYGTGWYYQPWIGTVWYGPPVTWGFGFSFCSSWWGPWPYYHPWFWAGWAPYPFFRPWWGPWIGPVVVGRPVVVGHGVPVVVAHGPSHVFQRWGGSVRPIGAPLRFGPAGNGTHAWGTNGGAVAPGSHAFAGGPGSGQSVQGFRHVDGQWQRFEGNGRWSNVNTPNSKASRINQSPPMAQGGGPRPGTPGGVPVAGGGPTWTRQATASSASHFAAGPQSSSGWSPPMRSQAPIASANPGGMQARSYYMPRVGYGQGWSGAPAQVGHRGVPMAGGHFMGMGGRGGGGHGGGHMGR
jgi:hypothetical protein